MKKETYTPEEIKEKFDALPADIKAVIYSADMLGQIQKIVEKYKLHIDKLDILEAETADVMTGFSKPEDFVSNLSSALSVDRAQAENIAKDINEGLFIKIRESLKQLYPPTATITAPPPAPTAPVAPQKPPEMHPADMMLSQKTITVAPPAPIKPEPYKADPYREPTN